MCGIAGFINYGQDFNYSKNVISDMSETLKRRGPDAEGVYCVQKCMPYT